MTENKARNIEVKWTGSFPTRCKGEWLIHIDGILLKSSVNADVLSEKMNTLISADHWDFSDNWAEVWETKTTGLSYQDWVGSYNFNKLKDIIAENNISELSETEWQTLYGKLQSKDFHRKTCGGCI